MADRRCYVGTSGWSYAHWAKGVYIYYNNDMQSSIATGTKTLVAADFSKFVVRSAGGVQFVRLNERYMDELEVGFVAYARKDSKVLDTRAVKYLAQA